MTRSTKTVVLASVVMLVIVVALSRCKSAEETKTEETTLKTDSTSEVEAVDTVAIATQKPLTVILKNLESATAPIYVSVYGVKSKFPSPKGQLKEYKFIPDGKEFSAEIKDLKFGTYALATYQDENSSGEIDKNFIGMPTEGFGFSNNYKPKVKAPAFKDCKFAYDSKHNSITVSMIR